MDPSNILCSPLLDTLPALSFFKANLIIRIFMHTICLSVLLLLTNTKVHSKQLSVVYTAMVTEDKGSIVVNCLVQKLHGGNIKQLCLPSQLISYPGDNVQLTAGTQGFLI